MKFLTFGEIMLRLKAPGQERFFQSPVLEATFGGGEANVAVSLANYGQDVAFLTVLPKNAIADECVKELRKFGVDTTRIVRGDQGRMGIYYLEAGANQLPSKVVYDRAWSAIALAKPGDIDWDAAFAGVDWFHITGITPAISETAMALSLESVKEAKKRGVTVSCDLNFRKNLWKYGKQASEIMGELAKFVDVAIANEEDVQKSLGITTDVVVESGSLYTYADVFNCYESFAITGEFSYSGSGSFGLAFDFNGKADKYKMISISPSENKLALYFNEGSTQIAEKEIALEPGMDYSFTYVQEGSVGVFYIDGVAALTVRIYGASGKPIMLFAENNGVVFTSLRQYTR